tara:strand:+ start:58 stop:306 length:249 start_codon:yes stop_codon:yes gene_type:complete
MAFVKIGSNPQGYKLGKKNEYKAPSGATPKTKKRDADRVHETNRRQKANDLNYHNTGDNYSQKRPQWEGVVTKVEIVNKGKK